MPISIFKAPVSNTTDHVEIEWPELCDMLLASPIVLPDNSQASKAKYGDYYIRGELDGSRNDENLMDCSVVILDVDKPLKGKQLPTPEESSKGLKGIAHVAVSSATPGRSRIIFPVEPYDKEDTGQITWAGYQFCWQRGLYFAYAGESKTKSQPWFFPQTTDIKQHQAYGQKVGELFSDDFVLDLDVLPSSFDTEDSEEESISDHNPMRDFIAALNSSTIHEAVKVFAGWRAKTSDLSTRQIFDEIEALIDSNCPDPKKLQRWHDSERAGLEKWFRANTSSGESKKVVPQQVSAKSVMEKYEVKTEYVNGLGKEEFLYKNLLIKQHILTIIAESGGGKTTFLFFFIAMELAKQDLTVWYVDADSPASDHKTMKDFADKHGFKFLIPDVNQGTSVESLITDVTALANAQTDLTGFVFFFDTLKKFMDLMSKRSAKDFFVLMRKLTKLGATVVLPGHANKHRDGDGNLIFEGVGDVKSDSDDLIFFEKAKKPDGSMDVTTVIDTDRGAKVRGLFKPFSFHINTSREISFYDKAKDLIDLSNTGVAKATDEDIIVVAEKYLKSRDEPVGQLQLVEYTMDKVDGQAGKRKVRETIVKRSVMIGDHQPFGTRFVFKVGDRNTHFYELPAEEKRQGTVWK